MISRIPILLIAAALAIPVVSCSESPAVKDPSVADLLPLILHNAAGEEVSSESLKGKYIGVYFSAHWCPPCRSFTPKLVEFRDAHAEENFEVVFVSFDNSPAEKSEYIEEAKMNWLSLPGNRTEEGNALALDVEIQGLPTLAVFAPDGSLITRDGRQDVTFSPKKALAKWKSAKQS